MFAQPVVVEIQGIALVPEFNDYDKSILYRCLKDKEDIHLHLSLERLIEDRLVHCPYELYRGITEPELNRIADLGEGDRFYFERVTSFSTKREIAAEFSNTYGYGTRTVIKIESGHLGFPYSDKMSIILYETPDIEYMTGKLNTKSAARLKRIEDYEMVVSEEEWMISGNMEFEIVSITNEEYPIGISSSMRTVYTVRIV